MHASVGKKPARWLLLFAVLALFAAACADDGDVTEEPTDAEEPADEATDEPTEEGTEPTEEGTEPTDEPTEEGTEPTEGAGEPGGVVLYGSEQEPTILNGFLIDGNALVTSEVLVNLLPASYRIHPDLTIQPNVIEGEAEITEDPFTVTYNIKEEAAWNDGTPVSAQDYIFTWETIMNPDYAEQIVSQDGYDLITEAEAVDEKTVTFTFSEPYAPYRLIFSDILPAHVLEGQDFLTVWNDAIVNPETGEPISAGPYLFDEWTKGQQLRLVRNDNYWDGEVLPDEIVMRYVPDATTLTQQFRGGEVNMFGPQPQIELVETLDEIDTAVYETIAGTTWEHIDFNQLVPGLDKTYVRQAIAYGIDRAAIVETLIAPIDPEIEPKNSIIYVNNDPNYEAHFDVYSFDPATAIGLLEENGCTRGEGDIFECEGDRLSFRFTTTGGNERRELTQQIVQSNLAEVGIEITIDNDEGAQAFERMDTPENCGGVCDFDLFLFAWVASGDPVGSANIWGCERPQNWTAYCNEEVTALMDQANSTLDPEERAALFNEADALMAEDVPILPIFQHASFLAWDESISGPAVNPTTATPFWNSQEWSVAQ